MLRNHIKIAWRNITRHKIYSTLNVLGLSLGICACIVIYLIISYEFSFDTFHPDKRLIYRVMGDVTESTGEKTHLMKLPMPLSQDIHDGIPGLEAMAGLIPYNAKISIPDGPTLTKHFDSRTETNDLGIAITEPRYFQIFTYDWLAGTPASALDAPFTVVLTERRARQYFGSLPLETMLGKQMVYEDSLRVTVSGIVKDWKGNTDLGFTDFISFSTLQHSFLKNNYPPDSWKQGDLSTWFFTKLSPGQTALHIETQLAALVKMHAGSQIKLNLWLEPITDIHFNADVVENPVRTAHKPTLYSLMGIALFILMLAVINFINLSTAQSIRRSKEVGIRKVMGGSRTNLLFQFLTETAALTILAVLLAIVLVNPVLSLFRSFIPNGVTFHLLESSTLAFLFLITLATTLLAGLYPAGMLSAYLPVLSLKGAGVTVGGEKWLLRKALIIFQFSVSFTFIFGSLVIALQLRYTQGKDPGFKADAIITAETPRGESFTRLSLVAQNIRQIPGVTNVALQWVPPMTDNSRGMRLKFKTTDVKETGVTQVAGNEAYIPLYGIKLLAGRNLEKSDSVREFVINETLSTLMDCKKPEEAIGKTLYWNDRPYPVVGVVADFHTSSLHRPITPLCIINRPERESALAIKLASAGKQSGMIKAMLSQIGKAWKEIYPASTFNYKFYDESLALLYEKDRQTATLTNTAMAITIIISCMGLFGLALLTTAKRAKEISIRKTMGASVHTIVTMLSKDIVMLVTIAFIIASPIAWYLMNRWLRGFAYHISISGWMLLSAGLAALLIALLTVSFQTIKAAMANPVENLRTE